jgi:hypothetical protein
VSRRAVRVANCSGFYGDRFAAAREQLAGPDPIDVLTGDYLAELTMLILWKARSKDPERGYATTFLRQMDEVLGDCLERGVKVVSNAGGLNPGALARRLTELAERLGARPVIAVVEGDDLIGRLDGLELRHIDTGAPLPATPVTANAYLGGWGIAEALRQGADIVVCGRVSDASLAVGPAAWWHGWRRADWDRLAGAVVAGHVLECGAQATGGNYPFLDELSGGLPGFPIAEIAADGSSVITKQPGSGGAVTVGTVTAQLLYEIAGPRYENPDVVARFDSIAICRAGPDRVAIGGVRGEPAPARLKVAVNYLGGFRNTMTMVLTGLDIEAKAARAEDLLFAALGGREQFDEVRTQLIRADRPDAAAGEQATAQLRVTVKSADPALVGRRFSGAVIEQALSSYAGFFTTSPPSGETAFGVYWPALVPADAVEHVVVLPGDRRMAIPHPEPAAGPPPAAPPDAESVAPTPGAPPPEAGAAPPSPAAAATDAGAAPPAPVAAEGGAAQGRRFAAGPTVRSPLGSVCGARSGDKGGDANVGVWALSVQAYEWLAGYLTVERFRELIPEAAQLEVKRYELPNLLAVNFVVVGLLGEGVAASTRFDPQAKGLGEFLRSRLADIPAEFLPEPASGSD